jgi:hypothetical protein
LLTYISALFSWKAYLMASVPYSAFDQNWSMLVKEKNESLRLRYTELHFIVMLMLTYIAALFSWKTCLMASVQYSALTRTGDHGGLRKEQNTKA